MTTLFYFLRQFLFQGGVFFIVMMVVFTTVNLLLRLPFITSLSLVPVLMWSMLPLMVVFSLPLASSMAVYTTIAMHKMRDELILACYLSSLKKSVYKAVGVFALGCCFIYSVFVLYLAPKSYQEGKQILLKVAKEHFLCLEPNKFHMPFPGLTFFFKQKGFKDHGSTFIKLVLIFKTKNNEQYFFSAQDGLFVANTLILHQGTLYTTKNNRAHVATFVQTDIDVFKFIEQDQKYAEFKQSKFLTFNKLISKYELESSAFIELHKRFSQIMWLFVLVIMAFLFSWTMNSGAQIATVIFCGLCYLFSYVMVILGSACESEPLKAVFIFYAIPLILLLVTWCFCKKRL